MKKTGQRAASLLANDNADEMPRSVLDRLLRYAKSEALSQNQEQAATFIDAAIRSLHDTVPALKS